VYLLYFVIKVSNLLHVLEYVCELLHVYRHDLDYDGLNYISLNVSLNANVNYTLLLLYIYRWRSDYKDHGSEM